MRTKADKIFIIIFSIFIVGAFITGIRGIHIERVNAELNSKIADLNADVSSKEGDIEVLEEKLENAKEVNNKLLTICAEEKSE